MRLQILTGDALTMLKTLPDESVHCCVTSPPYWGLRDYGVAGQLGLERTPEEYVAKMVEVFREVRRVLREDGTLWLNIGDSYARDFAKGGSGPNGKHDYIPAYGDARKLMSGTKGSSDGVVGRGDRAPMRMIRRGSGRADGIVTEESPRNRDGAFVNDSTWPIKPKDLVGIPWRLAFALQADGWWLRQDIIWHKPNPMPESVTDRCTKAHEYIFLLTKSARYFFDAEAIKEPLAGEPHSPGNRMHPDKISGPNDRNGHSQWETSMDKVWGESGTRNKRSVWTVATDPYSEAHFATFPPDLIKPCILAGTSARGCCPQCGAPWERILERTFVGSYHDHANDGKEYGLRQTGGGLRALDGRKSEAHLPPYEPPKTTGWQATCKCGYGGIEIGPCTVLDPFGGSGTSGMVALELGRKAILIELNPEYVKLAERRCHVTPGLALA